MTDKDYDVIINGAGPSGLSSALEAAKKGNLRFWLTWPTEKLLFNNC